MTYRKAILLTVWSLSSSLSLTAQLTPAEAITAMGRGINLGNTLEPPREGEWNNGPADEAYFDRYVEAGFTNVRVPVRWDQHTGNSAPYSIDADWMNRVEEVVDWGLERGLYVTLNGHHEDWLKNDYGNPLLRARYDAIWTQIVERFRDKSDKLLYEIINEPKGLSVAQVNDLNLRILGIIRQEEPTRLVIYGGNMYANSPELLAAAIPNDDYVIGYFHSYDPWPFAGLGNGSWGSPADYEALDAKFAEVANWSSANDVPVYLSEFGAVHQADYNSRMRYYAAYVEASVEYGFAFSVWDDGGMFGILNRAADSWPEVKDILINTYEDAPDQVTTESTQVPGDTVAVLVRWRNRATSTDSITVERSTDAGPFTAVNRLAPSSDSYVDATAEVGASYRYRLSTLRLPDQTLLQSYPSRIDFFDGQNGGVINYSDDLTDADNAFSGNPGGMTYAINNGILRVSGDGTATPYQTFRYALRKANGGPEVADAVNSGDRLFIRARSVSGGSAKLRIDLVDESDYHTTNAGRTVDVSGSEFAVYEFNYAGGYQDGAYGGTGCTTGPCTVNGQRTVALTFYPDADTGGFDETIEIDWLSFGRPLVTGVRELTTLENLKLYPNPATDQLRITYGLSEASVVSATVFDGIGRIVRLTDWGFQGAGDNETILDIRNIPSGIYRLQLHANGHPVRAVTFTKR